MPHTDLLNQALPQSTSSPIQQDIALLIQIKDLLATEQKHLEEGEPWKLPEITEQKQQLAEQLDCRYAAREPALKAAGLPLSMIGMQHWLRAQSTLRHEVFEPLWQEFITLAQEIQRMNLVNGQLIDRHLTNIQGRMHALRHASGQAQTYGADGLSQSAGLNHTAYTTA